MSYSPEYQTEYYRKRKLEISLIRKQKYAENKKYREAILQRARLRAALLSAKRKEERSKRSVEHNGKKERVYYISEMESIVNRDFDVLRSWKHQEIIPAPLFHDKKGRGLYTLSQVSFLARILQKLDTEDWAITYQDLYRILSDLWHETFSERKLNSVMREVVHGKYYAEDREKIWRKKSRYISKASDARA